MTVAETDAYAYAQPERIRGRQSSRGSLIQPSPRVTTLTLCCFRMTDLSIVDGKLIVHVHGADQLWALKSSLEIPVQHIAGVHADPSVARGWYHGIRMPGTNVPGVITAGTFYQHGQRVFWDVHNPDNTIVIE